MKAFWQLTLAQLRIFVRNRSVIFFTLLFPILLMLLLGTAFSNEGQLSLQVAVVDLDQTASSRQVMEQLQSMPVLAVTSGWDEETALDQLKNGHQQLVVVIPPNYSEMVNQATSDVGAPSATVTVYHDETMMMAQQVGLPLLVQAIDRLSKELLDYQPIITVEAQGIQSISLSYTDFLVPGIVAMMIMSTNLNGVAGQIAAWRERGILRRMQSTGLRSSTFISAQITARLILNGSQALLVLLIGYLFFDTQVNGSWALLLFFVILGTLTFMAIGFIIAGLAKTPESAGPIAGVISFPLLFLGGVFFPIKNMPEMIQPLIELLPIAHLSTALRQVMNLGADLTTLWPEALLLAGWLVIAFTIASLTFRWE